MACVFAAFTLVQFNDPDRWLWLALYGFATLACVSSAQQNFRFLAPLGLPMFIVLAVANYPGGDGGWMAEEAKRETLGLLICAGWMAVVTVAQLRGSQPPLRNGS